MTTQAPTSSQHLAATQELLDELKFVTQEAEADPQTKASTATAHAILVLAEQVAAIRVLMVEDVVSRRAQSRPAPQPEPAPQAGPAAPQTKNERH
jgi:hypothetical protein